MNRGEGVAAVIWGGCAGLVLSLAAACGDKGQSEGADDGGFYDGGAGEGGEGADGADGADGATDGGGGADGGDGASDGGLDEGGGTTGGGSGATDDGASDDGWDGGGDGGGDSSPTPAWEPDLTVSCEGGLDFQVHVIDSGGRLCVDDCEAGQTWLGGAIVNPCDEPLDVSLEGGSVIVGGLVEDADGSGMGWSAGSDGSVVTHTLPPGGYMLATEDLGRLDAGSWRFEIYFGDTGRHVAETARTLR